MKTTEPAPVPQQQTEATARPWTVGGHPRDDSGTLWREILANGEFGPMYIGQMLKQDAELAVRAVNRTAAFDAVVEALHWLVAADNCNYDRDVMRSEGLFDAARAALVLAEEQENQGE